MISYRKADLFERMKETRPLAVGDVVKLRMPHGLSIIHPDNRKIFFNRKGTIVAKRDDGMMNVLWEARGGVTAVLFDVDQKHLKRVEDRMDKKAKADAKGDAEHLHVLNEIEHIEDEVKKHTIRDTNDPKVIEQAEKHANKGSNRMDKKAYQNAIIQLAAKKKKKKVTLKKKK